MTFAETKQEFDKNNQNVIQFTSFLCKHLNYNPETIFKKKDGTKNEQYYKWQFLYALINSGLVANDYVGTEIHFPKGNKSSAPLIIDAVIFDDKNWFEHYKNYHQKNDMNSLEWLRDHMITAIEFKNERE